MSHLISNHQINLCGDILSKENMYKWVNLVTSFSALFAAVILTVSLFFPITRRALSLKPGSYIMFDNFTNRFVYVKNLTSTGCFLLIFLIIIGALGVLSIFLQIRDNNIESTKYLCIALLLFFYFPATLDWSTVGINSLAGFITIALTDAAQDVALGKVYPDYFTEYILTPWYFITMVSFLLLYISWTVMFFLYLTNGTSVQGDEHNTVFTYLTNKNPRRAIIIQRSIAVSGLLCTLLVFISMLVKPYHWVGPEANNETVTNFLIGQYYETGSDNISHSAKYLLFNAFWFWLQILVLLCYFVTYCIFALRRFNTYKLELLITIKLILVFLIPNAYIGFMYVNPYFSFVSGFIIYTVFLITMLYLDDLIKLVGLHRLYRKANLYDTTIKGHITIWLFLIGVIVLVMITIFMIVAFLRKKYESRPLEKQ